MNTETPQSAKTYLLELEGSWTIERAQELKSILSSTLTDNDSVLLDLAGLAQFDLSCLQLLCAAHRTSMKAGKVLAIKSRQSEVLKRVVLDAGFPRTMGCHKDPARDCLWKGDWEQ